MLDRGFVSDFSLMSCDVKRHAFLRYVFWCRQLGIHHPRSSWVYELNALLACAVPCRSIASTHRERRERRFKKPAEYFHAEGFRFVVVRENGIGVIVTVEPDIHPGDRGVWEKVLMDLYRRRNQKCDK